MGAAPAGAPGVAVDGMIARARSLWRWVRALWPVMLAVLVAGSLNPATAPPGAYGVDKLIHVGIYGCLALAPVVAAPSRRVGLALALLLLPLGVAIEWMQGWVPGREASVLDALAGGIGVAAGIGIGLALRFRG